MITKVNKTVTGKVYDYYGDIIMPVKLKGAGSCKYFISLKTGEQITIGYNETLTLRNKQELIKQMVQTQVVAKAAQDLMLPENNRVVRIDVTGASGTGKETICNAIIEGLAKKGMGVITYDRNGRRVAADRPNVILKHVEIQLRERTPAMIDEALIAQPELKTKDSYFKDMLNEVFGESGIAAIGMTILDILKNEQTVKPEPAKVTFSMPTFMVAERQSGEGIVQEVHIFSTDNIPKLDTDKINDIVAEDKRTESQKIRDRLRKSQETAKTEPKSIIEKVVTNNWGLYIVCEDYGYSINTILIEKLRQYYAMGEFDNFTNYNALNNEFYSHDILGNHLQTYVRVATEYLIEYEGLSRARARDTISGWHPNK